MSGSTPTAPTSQGMDSRGMGDKEKSAPSTTENSMNNKQKESAGKGKVEDTAGGKTSSSSTTGSSLLSGGSFDAYGTGSRDVSKITEGLDSWRQPQTNNSTDKKNEQSDKAPNVSSNSSTDPLARREFDPYGSGGSTTSPDLQGWLADGGKDKDKSKEKETMNSSGNRSPRDTKENSESSSGSAPSAGLMAKPNSSGSSSSSHDFGSPYGTSDGSTSSKPTDDNKQWLAPQTGGSDKDKAKENSKTPEIKLPDNLSGNLDTNKWLQGGSGESKPQAEKQTQDKDDSKANTQPQGQQQKDEGKKTEDKKQDGTTDKTADSIANSDLSKWYNPGAPLTEDQKKQLEKDKETGKKELDRHKQNTIQTTTDMYASGNGISAQQHGSDTSKIEKVTNTGVISGYSEVYQGHSQGSYTRVAHQLSGAGIAVRGDVKEKIENAGIISGSDFAILANGKGNDTAYSVANPKFESNLKGKVDNYGILAGRAIVAGYKVNATKNEGYEYYETIYDKDNKYNNYGIYAILDEKGEVKEIIVGEPKAKAENGKAQQVVAQANGSKKYNDKDIVNISEIEKSYEDKNSAEISNKIINGVGKTNGVVKVDSNSKITTIKNSIINGLKNAIKVDSKSITLDNSTINSNGFGDSRAIVGSDSADTVIVKNGTKLNGRVDLGKGDDKFSVFGKNQFNDIIDLGEGKNTLTFEKATHTRAKRDVEKQENTFLAEVNNANKVEIKDDVVFTPSTKITGVESVEISSGNSLEYRFIDKDRQAFADKVGKNLEIKGENGTINFTPIGNELQIGYIKNLLGYDINFNGVTPKVGGNTIGRDGFFIDERAKLDNGYSSKAFETYVDTYRKTGKNLLEGYLSSPEKLKSHLYNLTYNNPNTVLKTGAVSMLSEYYRAVSGSDFVAQDELVATGNYISHKKEYDRGNEFNFNGGVGKVTYGVSDNLNLSAHIGDGDVKAKGYDNIEGNSIIGGLELAYEHNPWMWTNSVAYQNIDGKKGGDMSIVSAYSKLHYDMALANNWFVTPKISAMFGHIEVDGTTNGNIVLDKQDENFFQGDLGVEIAKIKPTTNGILSFKVEGNYTLQSDLDDTSAHWVGGDKRFSLRSQNSSNYASGEIGVGYSHVSGISTKLSLRYGEDLRTINYGIGYTF